VLFPLATTPGFLADANALEDHFQRAKVGERGLQQVEPDKRREPEPIRAVIVREHQAQEDEQTGEPADDHVHFHGLIWVLDSTETTGNQQAKDDPKDRADPRIAREWTRTRRAAHKSVVRETESATHQRSDD
jgi:hypothetical protein